jgi:subtilisin
MNINRIFKLTLIASLFILSTLAVITPVVADTPKFFVLGKPGGGGSTPQVVDWGYARMGAAAARANVPAGAIINVAVLDTGVDAAHADLAGVVSWCFSGILRADYGCTNRNVKDSDGHGTHVAGTIAANDNTQGIVGAAASHVKIYSGKVLGRTGGDWNDLAWAIIHATQGPDHVAGTIDDADVISMSLGGDISAYPDLIATLQDAVDYASSYGVVVVAAAGNEGTCESGDYQSSYPAMLDGVIAVGATGIVSGDAFVQTWTGAEEDVMPCFSNQLPNNFVDISAPGVYITSLKLGGGTIVMSGTSMATPYTSAIIALLLADGVASGQVLSRIQSTAIDMGYSTSLQGAGLLNAAAAVN